MQLKVSLKLGQLFYLFSTQCNKFYLIFRGALYRYYLYLQNWINFKEILKSNSCKNGTFPHHSGFTDTINQFPIDFMIPRPHGFFIQVGYAEAGNKKV